MGETRGLKLPEGLPVWGEGRPSAPHLRAASCLCPGSQWSPAVGICGGGCGGAGFLEAGVVWGASWRAGWAWGLSEGRSVDK